MRKLYHLCLGIGILISATRQVSAQTVTVGVLTPSGPFCSGAISSLAFTTSANFANTQTFVAQISDAVGSFGAPVAIGSATGNSSGSISVTMPSVVSTGTGYLVRIVATDQVTAAITTSLNTSAAFTINPVPVPTITPSPATSVCPGTPVTYTTEAAQSNYVWLIPGAAGVDYTLQAGTGTNTSNTALVTWITSGSKAVTVNYSNGSCTGASAASTTTTVNVRPVPTFTTPGAGSFCPLTPITYTTQAAQNNYVWVIPGTAGVDYTLQAGTGISTSNTAVITWITTGSKTVTVNYADVNTCTGASPASTTNTVNPSPIASFTTAPGATVCVNSPVTYTTQTGGGITAYIWTFSGVLGVDYTLQAGTGIATSNTAVVTWQTPGSKTVTVNYTSGGGCVGIASATNTTTATARPVATFTASPGANTCVGNAVTYTTQAGQTSYTWTVPGTLGVDYTLGAGVITPIATATNSITLTWLTAGSKTVTVNYTDANGCTSSANATNTTTANSRPVATFTAAPVSNPCVGSPVIYSTQTGQSNYTWTVPGTAGVDYSISAGSITPVATATNSITLTWLTAGSKTVTVNYSNANGCTSVANATNTVSANARPTASFTTAPVTNPCVGSAVTYSTQLGQTNYTWTVPGTLGVDYSISAGSITPVATATSSITLTWITPGSKTITVNYTDGNGCTSVANATNTTTANPRPTASFTSAPATNPCVGTAVTYTTQAGQSNYTWTVPGALGVDYSIGAGSITPIATATNSITLTWLTSGSKTVNVNYSDANGCTSVANATNTVTANARPVASFTTAPGANNCAGSPTIYTTQTGGGFNNYIWSFPSGITINSGGTSADNTVTLTYSGTGSKTVTVNYTDNNGCTSVANASNTTTLIGVPVFASGATGSHCQGFVTLPFTATSSNGVVNNYTLTTLPNDPTTIINSATGAVTFSPGFIGTATITTTASGCSATASHVETVSQGIGTTSFAVATLPTACQGSTVTYVATNTGSATITYTISPVTAGTIGVSSGIANFNPAFTGTATITALGTASGAGCAGTSSANQSVVITPVVTQPVFNAGPLNTICQNPGTITYTATASNTIVPISYSLSPVAAGTIVSTSGQVSYSSTFTGTATITATATGCNGTSTNTFVVNVTPTVSAPVFTPVMPAVRKQGAGTVTYSATASNSTSIVYSLSPASAGNIVASTGAVTYNASFSGTATITATAFGCNATPVTNFVVTVVQTPVFVLGASSSRCEATGPVTYTANSSNGTVTYYLTTSPPNPATTINTNTGVVSYDSTFFGTATIAAVSTLGAVVTDTAKHIVTVNVAPRLTSPTPTSKVICSGDNTLIPLVSTTGAGSSFAWTLAGGANLSNQAGGSGTSINQTLTDNSNAIPDSLYYIVTVTSPAPASCLSIIKDSIKVRVNPKPLLATIAPTTICSESSINIGLGASAPSTFSWSVSAPAKITNASPGSGNLINQTLNNTDVTLPPGLPPSSGTATYTITPTSLAGCVGNSGTALVTVNPLPVVVFASGTSKTICSGQLTSIPLSANLSSAFTFTTSTITSLALVTGQSNGSGNTINQVLTNNNNYDADSIAYNVTPTTTSGSPTCVGKPSTVVVRVNPKPAVTSAAADSVCSGALDSTLLTATIPSKFAWSIGTVTGGITGQLPNATSSAVGSINLQLTNPSFTTAGFVDYIVTPTSVSFPNCVGNTDTITVKVNPSPKLTSSTTATICSDDVLSYTPTSSVTSGVTAFMYDRTSAVPTIANQFQQLTVGISDRLFTDFVLTPQIVDYNFTLTSAAGCKLSNQHLLVTVNPRPDTPGISIFPHPGLCSGATSMNFSTSRVPDPLEFFRWSTSNAGVPIQKPDSSFSQNALISFPNAGLATVTIESISRGFGCVSKPTTKQMQVKSASGAQSVNVVLFANNLVAQVSGAKAYQWGFDRKSDLDSTMLNGETTQSYDTRHGFNPAANYYWVMVTFPDDCVQKAFYNGPGLGVQPPAAESTDMKVYPNPVQNLVTIELPLANAKDISYEVYDLTGKRLVQVSSNRSRTDIDVADFAPGYYTITCVRAGVRIACGRFIKN